MRNSPTATISFPTSRQIAKLVQTMLVAPPTPEPSPDAMALAAIAASSLARRCRERQRRSGRGEVVRRRS